MDVLLGEIFKDYPDNVLRSSSWLREIWEMFLDQAWGLIGEIVDNPNLKSWSCFYPATATKPEYLMKKNIQAKDMCLGASGPSVLTAQVLYMLVIYKVWCKEQ